MALVFTLSIGDKVKVGENLIFECIGWNFNKSLVKFKIKGESITGEFNFEPERTYFFKKEIDIKVRKYKSNRQFKFSIKAPMSLAVDYIRRPKLNPEIKNNKRPENFGNR